MGKVYFMMFWIPTIASAVMLWIARSGGIVRHPTLLLAWFAIAWCLQFFSVTLSPLWAIGLAAQTILAVYLSIRMKLDMA